MALAERSEIRVSAPGRVNLLGEHLDYNDGPVLPAAIERHMRVVAQAAPGGVVTLQAPDMGAEVSFRLDQLEEKRTVSGAPLPGWARYPAGVAWSLQRLGFNVTAVKARYAGDIPAGAGLSSSAAVETAFAVLWQALGGWEADRMTLAQACLQAEREYVGVNCGLMDQFICLHGLAGHALHFDTRTLAWEPVELPPVGLVIADSKIAHQLAGSAYNQRRRECQEALQLLQRALPGIQALRDVTPEAFDQHADLLPETLRKRARHVVEECARVAQAVDCLKVGDLAGFGRLMLAGHASLRDLYKVSTPELDALVEIASQQEGCYGARLTGAGFGGCTINLVAWEHTDRFVHTLGRAYARLTGRRAEIFTTQAAPGARLETR